MKKSNVHPVRYVMWLVLALLCQGFQCEGDDYRHYLGGIVRDADTGLPAINILVHVADGQEYVHTDSCGKFGFYREYVRDRYELQFWDHSENKVYADFDTVVYPRNQKVLVEIFLRRSIN